MVTTDSYALGNYKNMYNFISNRFVYLLISDSFRPALPMVSKPGFVIYRKVWNYSHLLLLKFYLHILIVWSLFMSHITCYWNDYLVTHAGLCVN